MDRRGGLNAEGHKDDGISRSRERRVTARRRAGEIFAKLVAPQSFQPLPKEPLDGVLRDESLFCFRGPGIERENPHDIREKPLQDYLSEDELPELVQRAGRYEGKARPPAEPRHRAPMATRTCAPLFFSELNASMNNVRPGDPHSPGDRDFNKMYGPLLVRPTAWMISSRHPHDLQQVRGNHTSAPTNSTPPSPRPTTRITGPHCLTTETGAGQWGTALTLLLHLGLEAR
jgi:hypothetical protein